MQTPGSSSSAAGGHGGGGDRVGKRGRDGDEDPPNDDARRTVPPTTLFVGEDLSRTGKAGRGHVLCADCNKVHHHSKHCLEKKAARGAHISALLQPKDSAPVHTDSDGVETLQIQHIPFWLLQAITRVEEAQECLQAPELAAGTTVPVDASGEPASAGVADTQSSPAVQIAALLQDASSLLSGNPDMWTRERKITVRLSSTLARSLRQDLHLDRFHDAAAFRSLVSLTLITRLLATSSALSDTLKAERVDRLKDVATLSSHSSRDPTAGPQEMAVASLSVPALWGKFRADVDLRLSKYFSERSATIFGASSNECRASNAAQKWAAAANHMVCNPPLHEPISPHLEPYFDWLCAFIGGSVVSEGVGLESSTDGEGAAQRGIVDVAARRILSQLLALRSPHGQQALNTMQLANHLGLMRSNVSHSAMRPLWHAGHTFDTRNNRVITSSIVKCAEELVRKRLNISGVDLKEDVVGVMLALDNVEEYSCDANYSQRAYT